MKIQFTQEHLDRMKELSLKMLLNNTTVTSKLGQPYTIQELLHSVTINTLNNIRVSIYKRIDFLENQDEWTNLECQKDLAQLKETKELITLIIGYKRYKQELEEIAAKRLKLSVELQSLKEAQKTPEDKIKEIEEKLEELKAEELN